MGKKELSPINAGSMADIAFLLLIFFLVTTTMDVDTGLQRRLPRLPDENQQENSSDKIKERNVFVVNVNKNDDLQVENKLIDLHQLRQKAKEFIANPNNAENFPEKEMKELPYFGSVFITKNPVISLTNDRGTSYGMYLRVQNELVAAKNELRDDISIQQFGANFDELTESQMEAVKNYYPSVLSEAEPRNN